MRKKFVKKHIKFQWNWRKDFNAPPWIIVDGKFFIWFYYFLRRPRKRSFNKKKCFHFFFRPAPKTYDDVKSERKHPVSRLLKVIGVLSFMTHWVVEHDRIFQNRISVSSCSTTCRLHYVIFASFHLFVPRLSFTTRENRKQQKTFSRDFRTKFQVCCLMSRYCTAIFLLSSNGINPHYKCDSSAQKMESAKWSSRLSSTITNESLNDCYQRQNFKFISFTVNNMPLWVVARVDAVNKLNCLGMRYSIVPLIQWSLQRDSTWTR